MVDWGMGIRNCFQIGLLLLAFTFKVYSNEGLGLGAMTPKSSKVIAFKESPEGYKEVTLKPKEYSSIRFQAVNVTEYHLRFQHGGVNYYMTIDLVVHRPDSKRKVKLDPEQEYQFQFVLREKHTQAKNSRLAELRAIYQGEKLIHLVPDGTDHSREYSLSVRSLWQAYHSEVKRLGLKKQELKVYGIDPQAKNMCLIRGDTLYRLSMGKLTPVEQAKVFPIEGVNRISYENRMFRLWADGSLVMSCWPQK